MDVRVAEQSTLPTPEMARPMLRLVLLAAALTGGLALLLAAVLAALPRDRLVMEIRDSGLAGSVIGALLLALAGLAGTALMAQARLAAQQDAALGGAPQRIGRMARRPQGVAVPLLAGAGLAVLWALRPLGGPTLPPEAQYLIAGAALGLAFPLLVAERTLATTQAAWLPEAPWLAALLFLPVATLALHAGLAVLDGLGAAGPEGAWGVTVARGVSLVLALAALELTVRGLLQWLLPVPAAASARAAADSLAARLLHPGGLARSGLAAPLRSQFGIDFSRSWALAYLRAAAVPMLLLTLLFCWGLSGVRLVELDRRAVYERLGVPVAVLQPGLHLLLPWPLGTVRRTEYGVVHALPLGQGATTVIDTAAAEDPAPPSADRLWNQSHQNELPVLIASESAGQQSFQTVSLDIRVLYRIGLDDRAVLQSVYGAADPDALVRSAAGRLLARDFAGRTLDAALGENRESLAGSLRAALQTDLDAKTSGLEVLAVVIEGIHPPAGAADAYHRVQAAEILANASVANERGRAEATASYARQEARDRTGRAQAGAAERVAAAQADSTGFSADQRAQTAGGPVFLLERYFADLSSALSKAPLVILDHRLTAPDGPVLDLRPLGGAAAPKGPLDDD